MPFTFRNFSGPRLTSRLTMGLLTTFAVGVVAFTGGRTSGFVSLLFLPIILAVVRYKFQIVLVVGITLSLIYLAFPSARVNGPYITPREVMMLMSLELTTLIGAFYAIQVQRERRHLQKTVGEQEALLNVSQMVNSCEKLEHALDSCLLMLQTMLPHVRYAAVLLFDDTRTSLVRTTDMGVNCNSHLPENVELKTIAGSWSPESSNPYYEKDPLSKFESAAGLMATGSYVCVGLRSLTVPIGVLFVSCEQPNGFSTGNIAFLRAFSERIGFPLQKIRQQEGLQSMAYSDSMTGLSNYRAFRANLEDEWNRAVRYRRPLSLILLDIDGFKGVNDRYGHLVGDQLLISLAKILMETVRTTDMPARYGGEEFAVVCPETSVAEVMTVAERIRSAVEYAHFRLAGDEPARITCSVGIATYPVHAGSELMLIDAADAALYAAKRGGKNRVSAAEPLPTAVVETAVVETAVVVEVNPDTSLA